MRTMFVSHQLNPSKKKFQKPNILRRKSKVSVQRQDGSHVNKLPQVVNSLSQHESVKENPLRLHVEISGAQNTSFQNIDDNVKKYIVTSNIKEETELSNNNFDSNINSIIFDNNEPVNNNENFGQDLLNIESFLNSTAVEQDTLKPVHTKDILAKEYWCLQLVDESKETVFSTSDVSQLSNMEKKLDLSDTVSLTAISSVQNLTPNSPNNIITMVPQSENVSNDTTSTAIKFKCDEPNCKKGFWSELNLKKHKGTHNKQGKGTTSEIKAECPVKKVNGEGVEEQCGRVFLTTEDLLKHLNEDHTPDNGLYRCAACGVVSLCGSRARGAAGAAGVAGAACTQGRPSRGTLTCSWPGCGRVFRQPCRLREHARAHTGDRPYPCLFPNCGWSFRSASKLLRHARRHTGDRRHTCASCGRAFLRREHLRDHCARTHPDTPHEPRARSALPAIRPCSYADCDETFTSASARYVHMRKVHKKAESSSKKTRSDVLVVNLMPKSEIEDTNTHVSETVLAERSILEEMKLESACEVSAESGGECAGQCTSVGECTSMGECTGEGLCMGVGECIRVGECSSEGDEWHAARTHCTWPLEQRHRSLYEQTLDTSYVLEDDVPVEQSESSESNIYTIRSDLFLHGNVLINEDSEFVVSREYLGRSSSAVLEGGVEAEGSRDHSGAVHTLDAGLDLIDSHPTIDLMQEELMYADTAVDESSFRVFFT